MSSYNFNGALGVIAGSGKFPEAVIRKAKEHGQRVVLCAHVNECEESLLRLVDAHVWIKVGQIGSIIKFLQKQNVTQAIMTGAISRLKLFKSAMPDWRALNIIRRAGSIQDDIILRAITQEFETEGISIFSSAELLGDFLVKNGLYTSRMPSGDEINNARLGWNAAKVLGSLDIGQTAVVTDGLVTALECVEGTDAAIQRAGSLTHKKSSVVVKLPKPQQDKRLDLPSIGTKTIQIMIENRCTLLVLESGGAMILEPEEVVRAANKAAFSVLAVSSKEELDKFVQTN